MSKFKLAVVAIVTFIAYPQQNAEAFAPLSSEPFSSHCIEYRSSPERGGGLFCVPDIQGSIDGAIATDERVTRNPAAQYEEGEAPAQRVIRTRPGRTDFKPQTLLARNVVYQVLRDDYPYEPKKSGPGQ